MANVVKMRVHQNDIADLLEYADRETIYCVLFSADIQGAFGSAEHRILLATP